MTLEIADVYNGADCYTFATSQFQAANECKTRKLTNGSTSHTYSAVRYIQEVTHQFILK